jgi:hypothetical protein
VSPEDSIRLSQFVRCAQRRFDLRLLAGAFADSRPAPDIHAFAMLHGKQVRLGRATLNEVRKRIYRSLLSGHSIQFFSGKRRSSRRHDPSSRRAGEIRRGQVRHREPEGSGVPRGPGAQAQGPQD